MKYICIAALLSMLMTACGKEGDYSGIRYEIYDSDSLSMDGQVDYGCIKVEGKEGLTLTGSDRIRLYGKDATIYWTKDDDKNITFEVWYDGGRQSKTKSLDYFKKGKLTTMYLDTNTSREISIDIRGHDC